MLRALMHSKDLGVHLNATKKTSWRDIFRTSEDFLTASVFSRLSYLDAPMLWQILCEAFGRELPRYKVVELEDIQFWPRWELSTRSFVEPDIFLRFKLGDPEVRADVLIEAKVNDTYLQSSVQWREELAAYREMMAAEGDQAASLYFLAIGGLGRNYSSTLNNLISNLAISDVDNVHILGASWSKLTDVIYMLSQGNVGQKRIFSDVLEALAMCGERRILELSTLRGYNRNWNMNLVTALQDYDYE